MVQRIQTGSGATWGNGDIVGCAVDLDNRKIYWHKNGTYINSGNPSAGSGGQTIPSDLTYYGTVSGYTSTTFQCNFGDGFLEQQQYLQKELMLVILVNLSMMYQQDILLFQLKD